MSSWMISRRSCEVVTLGFGRGRSHGTNQKLNSYLSHMINNFMATLHAQIHFHKQFDRGTNNACACKYVRLRLPKIAVSQTRRPKGIIALEIPPEA